MVGPWRIAQFSAIPSHAGRLVALLHAPLTPPQKHMTLPEGFSTDCAKQCGKALFHLTNPQKTIALPSRVIDNRPGYQSRFPPSRRDFGAAAPVTSSSLNRGPICRVPAQIRNPRTGYTRTAVAVAVSSVALRMPRTMRQLGAVPSWPSMPPPLVPTFSSSPRSASAVGRRPGCLG